MGTQPLQNEKPPAVMAVTYKVCGKLIPARLTIAERNTFVLGLGVPSPQAAVFAVQDRASSLANVLSVLVEQSGNPELIARVGREITKWNDECDAFLRVR